MGLSEEVETEYKEAYACFAQDKQGEDKGKSIGRRRFSSNRIGAFPRFESIALWTVILQAQHSLSCVSLILYNM